MKRILGFLALIVLLTGCGNSALDEAMEVREQIQHGNGCSFDATITADYGDELHEFQMHCKTDELGNLSFSVIAPETIAGITGVVSDEGGKLTFEDKALMFELMADGQITPVSAPWVFVKTLRSGYLNACTYTDSGMMLIIDDSYEEDALKLEILFDSNNIPTNAEILWDGRRILSLKINDFVFL